MIANVYVPLWVFGLPFIILPLAIDAVVWLRRKFGAGSRRSSASWGLRAATGRRVGTDSPRVRVLARTGRKDTE